MSSMPRVLIATGTAVLVFVLAACSPARLVPTSPSQRPSGPAPGGSASASPTQPLSPATVIELPRLPPKGIAAQWSTQGGSGVDLLSLDGRRIARLRDFTINNSLSRPRNVILTRRGEDYLLLVAAQRLRQKTLNERLKPPPTDTPGPPGSSGSWLWTYRSRDSSGLLGQWREQVSECSLPVALIGDPAGWVVSTGSTSTADAPASIGLGWTAGGRPVVAVEGGPCNGVTEPRTGVYVVASPGQMDLIATPTGSYSFRMWGPR
jgi:hypothetical protein